jgi:hypothetical protein
MDFYFAAQGGAVMPINRQALLEIRKRLKRGLVAVAVELTNQAKVRATKLVNTGELRNSITHAVIPNGVIWGIPRNKKNESLEYGFKPHFVPSGIIGGWMKRNRVGIVSARSSRRLNNGRRSRARTKFLSAGVFVGYKNSRLEQGPGTLSATFFGKRKTWNTKGGKSNLYPAGKVGFSVVRWTIKNRLRAVSATAFARGYGNA